MAEKRKAESKKKNEEEEKKKATATTSAYTSKDLSGLKVQHDLEAFVEGSEVILTLQDTNVLTEDGDINREVRTIALYSVSSLLIS
jgi:U4/U6.U5 tri-snRNP-associated protein 1